jgi:hypothetical protein
VEEDLSAIKEKNAQLSDELLAKSRQLAAIENTPRVAPAKVPGVVITQAANPAMVAQADGRVADLEKQARTWGMHCTHSMQCRYVDVAFMRSQQNTFPSAT